MRNYIVKEFLLLSILIIFIFPIKAHADMGPKPSIIVELKNIDENCYVSMLTPSKDLIFYEKWSGDEKDIKDPFGNLEVWKKFIEYQDKDGFNFLQFGAVCNKDKNTLSWGYMPPERFKLLIYFPKTDTFIESDIYEQYAFDSYYAVNIKRAIKENHIVLYKNYDFTYEIISMIIRMFITIWVELYIARKMFKLTDKKSKLIIVITNIITQLVFNICLNIEAYKYGLGIYYYIDYIKYEIWVFIAEALIYKLTFNRILKNNAISGVKYALGANVASFLLGVEISVILTMIEMVFS